MLSYTKSRFAGKNLILVFCFTVLVNANIFSQALPHEISYQGLLKDASDVVVANGNYTFTFKLYETESGGTDIWKETQLITVTDGIITAKLGSVNPIVLPFDKTYWLGITIGSDSELNPRTKLSTVPYSYMSMNVMNGSINADNINGGQVVKSLNTLKDDVNLVAGSNISITPSGNNLTISAAVGGTGTIGGVGTAKYIPVFIDDVTLSNSEIYQSEGNVGIGTINPTAKFTVAGADALINGLTIGKGSNNINTNTAVGFHSLYSSTTGYHNAAFGYASLLSNQTGNYNNAFGVWSLRNNIDGISNTAFGYSTLSNNTSGSYNTALGSIALVNNTNGNSNTAAGFGALWSNVGNNGNTAVGYYSMYYADNRTDGILTHNTAVGYRTLVGSESAANNNGLYNTAIGSIALSQNISGNGNTAIGYNSGNGSTTNSYCTFVGANSYSDIISGLENASGFGYNSRPTASNQVHIGNSSVTSIGGFADWTNFSDGRYKNAVQENVKGLDFIMKLRPITYQLDINQLAADLGENEIKDGAGNNAFNISNNEVASRNEKSKIVYTGFIAQEVEKAAIESGYNFSGVDTPKNENDFYGLRYAEFVVPLVKAVQEQQKIIEELTKRIEELERK